MTMLTVNFHGICVNFVNVIPGIPHRVVLPDALNVRFGTVRIGEQPEAAYYLLPHFAFIRTEPTSEIAGDAGFVQPVHRVHIRILNATRPPAMEYPPLHDVVPYSLSRYAGDTMTFSDEVVLGGRAACYFDFDQGIVRYNATERGARYTSVEVETDGPPEILIRSFPRSSGVVESEQITLDAQMLTVGNVDFDPPAEDDYFDFLLNYLVARNGIPEVLDLPAPGMPSHLQSASPQRIAKALHALAERIAGRSGYGEWVTKDEIAAWTPNVLTASCSNSNWP